MNNNSQMELRFEASQPRLRRARKQSRAQWWFSQMREVVDRAFDWHNAPPSRGDQVFLELGR